MNTSFQFQLPASLGQFVDNHLGLILLLFLIGFLLAARFLIKERIASWKRIWRTLTVTFKRSARGK
jgi:hypothetical protein